MARGRAPCCDKIGLKKGPWTPAEDMRLMAYVQKFGHGNWRALPKQAGLLRCGKSCRLRWTNYLRPDIKRGNFTAEEEEAIINLHELLGNKWSKIASQLPGRTDNEIKNVWNTHLKKRLVSKGPNPSEEKPKDSPSSSSSNSSISYCNRSEGTPNEDPTMNLVPSENTQDLQQDLIEIPIESNFDFWDMIDDNPPYLPERIGNNIMNILDTDNHKESSSSSSNSSVTTHCNQGEAKEFEEIPGPLYQSFHDMMPKENKPNKLELMEEVIPENTPIGLNLDFWGMLDDDCRSFTSSVGLRCGNEGHQNTNLQEETAGDVGSWWITYLENELELWTASGDAIKI